jgi:hypothetical protein
MSEITRLTPCSYDGVGENVGSPNRLFATRSVQHLARMPVGNRLRKEESIPQSRLESQS